MTLVIWYIRWVCPVMWFVCSGFFLFVFFFFAILRKLHHFPSGSYGTRVCIFFADLDFGETDWTKDSLGAFSVCKYMILLKPGSPGLSKQRVWHRT